ncbi:MAG: gliding motility-associated C-terminal domain-containing protein, partial [Saprospiraceae bacterium]
FDSEQDWLVREAHRQLQGQVAAVGGTGTPAAVATVPGPITCADPTRTINTSGSSSGTNFTYVWVTSDGHFISGQNTPAPVVDAPGLYALTITNTANGCTASTTVSVTEDTAAPPADAGPDMLLTCTTPVFSLSANGGQTLGLQFVWQTADGGFSGNPNSAAVNTTLPGTYNLTVTNPQNGCTATDTAIVTADQIPPNVAISAPALLTCTQTTATLSTTGGVSGFVYQWITPDGQFVSGENGPAPVVDAPGQYDLVVTNPQNGCTQTLSAAVDQNIAIPQAAVAPAPTLTCVLTQTTLLGTVEPGPGIVVGWTATLGGNIVSGGTTPNPVVNQPGNYLLLVTNTTNGCTNTASVSVAQNTVLPSANAGQTATLSCLVNSLTLIGTGSASGTPAFAWSTAAGGNIVSGANTLSPVVNAAGQYTLLVTDLVNGCTASSTVLVQNDAGAPTAAIGQPAVLTCALTQTALPGSGSTGGIFTPAWAVSGGGNIVSGGNGFTPVVNAPGVYTLTVTNTQNGCTATAQTTVLRNITPPPVSIAPPGTLTCAVQSLALAGAPTGAGFTYAWQTTGGNIVSGGNTAAPTVNQPGAYTLTVTDQSNGCTATASVSVGSNTAAPVISAAAPQTLTCAVKQVPISGTVSQPANGFSAMWTTANGQFVSGQNTLAPIVSAPGNYLLTVQNQQNGCTATATTTVSQNTTPPVANATPAPTITCGQPQVPLSAATSTGQGTLSFAWSGGQIVSGGNTPTPTVSQAATYTVTVTDGANGCTATASVSVQNNTVPPVAVIAPPLPRTCVRDTVTLNASASNSGPNFTINWSTTNGHFTGGQTTLNPQVNAAGTYTLLLTNTQNGCTATATATVTQDLAAPNANAGPAAELYCDQPEATLAGSSSTPGTMNFSWTAGPGGNILSGANTASPVVNAPGIYLLTVTNPQNGCAATASVPVTEIPLPTFAPTLTQPNCHISTGAVAFGPVSGGEAPFRYSVNGGQSFQVSPNFSGLKPGPYDLVVIDALGCITDVMVAIAPPFFPTVTLSVVPALELGDSVQLEPVLNLPANQVADWIWTPAYGLSCTDCPAPWARPFLPTQYRLRIVDLNGCTAEATVLVPVNRRRNLYAPNVFSPDGDGQNDRFLLFGRGVKNVRSLRIFDRWGNELYFNQNLPINDETTGWDGNYRGQPMQPGVYVWQAEVEFVDGGVEVFAGDVTVVR